MLNSFNFIKNNNFSISDFIYITLFLKQIIIAKMGLTPKLKDVAQKRNLAMLMKDIVIRMKNA